ncbi:MAG: FHA domain-containing protein [Acidobacteriota bacterium]
MGRLRILDHGATIGRNADCALQVSDADVSRVYARLCKTAEGWAVQIEDGVTHEGMLAINGMSVRRGARRALHAGDRMVIGKSPVYRVRLEGESLVLEFDEETQREPPAKDRTRRVMVHPVDRAPKALLERFEVTGDAPGPANELDAALIFEHRASELAPRMEELRSERFFLPIAVVGDAPPRPNTAPFPVQGDAYLWEAALDPRLADKLAELIARCQERERATLPYHTAEIVYLDGAVGRVFAHDWVNQAPRDVELSELQHHILYVIGHAQHHQPGFMGLDVADVGRRLEQRGWARSDHTVANELSSRLPRALRAGRFHPKLFHASGTREKTYGLSTPPGCLREFAGTR